MEEIKKVLKDSIDLKSCILKDDNIINRISGITDRLTEVLKKGNRVFLAGNGGSAADAQHLAAEFTGRFYMERKAYSVEALHCNSSYMTAVSNDYSYNRVYSRLVEGIINRGDILWLFSTSGDSQNIVNAAKAAKEKGIEVISFTGAGGGNLKSVSDHLIDVPSAITPRIQECHMIIGHIICEIAEKKLTR